MLLLVAVLVGTGLAVAATAGSQAARYSDGGDHTAKPDSADGGTGTAIEGAIPLRIDVAYLDEPGTVTIAGGDTEVGTRLWASVVDPDGIVAGLTWRWSGSARPDGGFTDIDHAATASYTPADADNAMFLRATAAYTDSRGQPRTAHSTTILPVGVGETTFLSNLDQNQAADQPRFHLDGVPGYQGFTTGDDPGGYALSQVVVRSYEPTTTARLEIWTSKTATVGGDRIEWPHRRLVRLISPDPVTPEAGTLHELAFKAPPGTVLAPNSVYHMKHIDFASLASSVDGGTTGDPSPGWSVGAGAKRFADGAATYSSWTHQSLISIRGIVLPVVPAWSPPETSGGPDITNHQDRHRAVAAHTEGHGSGKTAQNTTPVVKSAPATPVNNDNGQRTTENRRRIRSTTPANNGGQTTEDGQRTTENGQQINVTSPTGDGAYYTGDVIDVRVTFDETVDLSRHTIVDEGSDTAEPEGTYAELDGAWGVATHTMGAKHYAVVASLEDSGVQIIDITNPANPTAVASLDDDDDLALAVGARDRRPHHQRRGWREALCPGGLLDRPRNADHRHHQTPKARRPSARRPH